VILFIQLLMYYYYC